MLLQFSIKNLQTFKEKATLSMLASAYDKTTRAEENIYLEEKYGLKILKSAVVYGANASGKTKLLEAFLFMREFVIHSSKDTQKGEPIPVQPFLLSEETEQEPSELEIVFIYQDKQYRYGFEVNSKTVVAEWLYYKPKTKEIELFYREGKTVEAHARNFSKGALVAKEGLVRDNALLLSVAAQFNEQEALNVLNWFERLKAISGLHEKGFQDFTLSKVEDPIYKPQIIALLKAADLSIQDVILETIDIEMLPQELKEDILKKQVIPVKAHTIHKKYNKDKVHTTDVRFSLTEDESSGTQKYFALSGPILHVLERGEILMVDELDVKLHPHLVSKIIEMFNSKELNKNNAQLIFNTHNVNLLNSGLFRRDQIWFTQKDRYGAASLYSLADFKTGKARKGASYETNYLRGQYGAVPYLGFFEDLKEILQFDKVQETHKE